jgi:5-methyltetrahydrofolate--homocysteine methyltransferase
LRTLQGLAAHTPAQALIAKGNAGIPKYVDGHIHYDGTPELMADYAVMARDSGATIIGGCCGTMPDHLSAMREALETRPSADKPSHQDITKALGAFSSETDGTEPGGAPPTRVRRGRRK